MIAQCIGGLIVSAFVGAAQEAGRLEARGHGSQRLRGVTSVGVGWVGWCVGVLLIHVSSLLMDREGHYSYH